MTELQLHEIVTEMLAHLGLAINAEISQDGDVYLINLKGSDCRFLERGKDNRQGAFVTLVKLIAKQRYDSDPRLILDFNGQRSQRLENIAQLARKKAEMVRVSGQEEEMPPMTPAERRAVHVALKEMTGIRTESRGVEPHRRIVIILDEE
ncbi:MAG TPA: R3H domain-containing nucleic acid-binding protein [Patescibacteria group bacterium]